MKPTLLLLAAGMGSRYGGLKQLDGLGPNGETIMDYSIYDAIQAGFGKIVFVIRKDFEDEFRQNMKGIFLPNWFFKALMRCPKVSVFPKVARNPGAPTTPCSWPRM